MTAGSGCGSRVVHPDPPPGPQVDDTLAVREEGDAFLAVRKEDPKDWLARVDKGGGVPARARGGQVADALAVREEGDACLVVRKEDPKDWLARFDKGGGFPARAWAENMVEVYK